MRYKFKYLVILRVIVTLFAVPVVSPEGLKSKVSEHFARSEYFALVLVEKGKIRSAEVSRCVPEDDKKKAEWLVGKGVEVVLAGRIGACMTRILTDGGLRIYSGAEGTIKEALKEYGLGSLAEVHLNPYQL
jgi:predicted Fe-Mo cluster-binding NifX family protein